MNKRYVYVLVALLVAGLVLGTGCISKKKYREDTEATDQRVAGVESGVEANERRLDELSDKTDAAVAKAQGTADEALAVGKGAAAEAASAKMTAEEAKRGKLLWSVVITEEDLGFGFDQASLPDTTQAGLDEMINKVKGMNRAVYVEIQGHTDNIGSAEYNKALGYKRAMAVRNYLNEKGGFPLHSMNVISYGEERPIADNSTPDGRAANRRVVVNVLE